MRTSLIVLVLVVTPAMAQAQYNWHLRSARGRQVTVIDVDSREWQGRLRQVSTEAITVDIGAAGRRFDIGDVARVQAHGDKVWDGGLKGAVFGAAMAVVLGGRARVVGESALAYALVGIGLDALNNCRHVVYTAPAPTARITLRW